MGGRGRLYTCCYTVTTRMIPALRWAAMRTVLMFYWSSCEGQNHRSGHWQTATFSLKKRESRSGIEPRPSCESLATSLKPVLNWMNVCSPEHTSDTSTNYDSFLNWTFSSPNMVRTVQTLLHSQLACNEMQASARTCGRRAADSMIENLG